MEREGSHGTVNLIERDTPEFGLFYVLSNDSSILGIPDTPEKQWDRQVDKPLNGPPVYT